MPCMMCDKKLRWNQAYNTRSQMLKIEGVAVVNVKHTDSYVCATVYGHKNHKDHADSCIYTSACGVEKCQETFIF